MYDLWCVCLFVFCFVLGGFLTCFLSFFLLIVSLVCWFDLANVFDTRGMDSRRSIVEAYPWCCKKSPLHDAFASFLKKNRNYLLSDPHPVTHVDSFRML